MNINKILDKFKDLNVLIIGDIMLDTYSIGRVERISPEAPVPILKLERNESRLGGAGNVALNVKSLGAEVTIYSVVGDDIYGRELIHLLHKNDISTEIVVDNNRRTTVKNRFISGNHHLLRVDEEDDSIISDDITENFLDSLHKDINNYDVIIIEDYDKGVLHKKFIENIIHLANENNVYTLVDPKIKNFHYYNGVTILKPNLKELQNGLNILDNNIDEHCNKMIKKMNLVGCLVTLSENGAYINYDGKSNKVDAIKTEITDVSGAGDTVSAVAALCLSLNLPPIEILTISNIAGGLVCKHPGVVPINIDELINVLK